MRNDLEILVYCREKKKEENFLFCFLFLTFLHKEYWSHCRREVIGGRRSHWNQRGNFICCQYKTSSCFWSQSKFQFQNSLHYSEYILFAALVIILLTAWTHPNPGRNLASRASYPASYSGYVLILYGMNAIS